MKGHSRKAPIKKRDLNPNPLPMSLPLPASTTEQEDMVTAGQRRINLIWEYTQSFIALFTMLIVLPLGAYLGATGKTDDFPPFLSLAFGLIIGFYFSRTNHEKIGGVGAKTNTSYRGR